MGHEFELGQRQPGQYPLQISARGEIRRSGRRLDEQRVLQRIEGSLQDTIIMLAD